MRYSTADTPCQAPKLKPAAALLAMNEWILKRVMHLAQTHGTAAK
jgi:hypothetical protein